MEKRKDSMKMVESNLHLPQHRSGLKFSNESIRLTKIAGPINSIAIRTKGQTAQRSADSTQSPNQKNSDERMKSIATLDESDANKDPSSNLSQAEIRSMLNEIRLVKPLTSVITKVNPASINRKSLKKATKTSPTALTNTITRNKIASTKKILLKRVSTSTTTALQVKKRRCEISDSSSTSSDTEEEVSLRKKLLGQPQMNYSIQKRSYKKRSEEDICKDLVSKRDKKILFNELSKQLDAETIRQKYDEKKRGCNEENLQVEPTKTDLTRSAAIMSSLQKTLIEFSSLANDDFIDTMLKTFGRRLKASTVLEIFDKDELIATVRQKFRDIDLFNLLEMKNDPDVIQKVLETAPFSTIEDLVKTKENLKNSELLLNVLLDNGPKNFSNETKSKIKDVLMKKFATTELAGLLADVVKVHMAHSIIEL